MPADSTTLLDPGRANHITILGRKGTGKSVLARRFWDTYPGDRLVIDPTGDVVLEPEPGLQQLTTPLPIRWPTGTQEGRSTLRFAADPGSATYVDDLDRAVGLAFNRGRSLLWVDEVGEITRANSTPPAMRRCLHQSRHRGLTTLFCGPRPVDVNPLVLSQADYIAAFDTPNPKDRQRLADAMGLELRELEAAFGELDDEHGFLWWDTRARDLLVMPPLRLGGTNRAPARRFESKDTSMTA